MNENKTINQAAEAAGSAAFAAGQKRVCPLEIQQLGVGHPAMAWFRGWDRSNIAAPVPAWTAEENSAWADREAARNANSPAPAEDLQAANLTAWCNDHAVSAANYLR